MFKTIVIVVLAGVCFGEKPSGGHIEVDTAIENVGLHYNDKLCLDLLMVDCANHVTVHDEQICATNGVTYPNHCRYVHAYCEFIQNPRLSVASLGVCPVTTTQPIVTTAALSGSSGPSVVITTAAPAGSSVAPAGSTVAPAPVSTSGVITAAPVTTTTTAAATTTNPNHHIIQNVFCMNAAGISCAASGVDVICGNNGNLYPNQCEFAKAHCIIPTLEHADASNCASPGK